MREKRERRKGKDDGSEEERRGKEMEGKERKEMMDRRE